MEPMSAGRPTDKKSMKWLFRLGTAVVLILLSLLAWLLFLLYQPAGTTNITVGTQPTIRLEGTKLVMQGISPGEVDLSSLLDGIRGQLNQKPGATSSVINNIYNSYPTTQNNIIGGEHGDINTDNQTLAISGNILAISGGNSVSLPSAPPEQDGVVGNEVTGVVTGGGLLLVGSGTTLDPYKVGIRACANGEILKNNGIDWVCAADAGGAAYTAGNGLQLIGANFSVASPTCAGTTKLQWNGTAFVCSTDVDTDTNTTYSAGSGLSLVGTTFSNAGTLGVTGSGAITSSGGQNPNIAFVAGTTTGQFWQWNGSAWVLTTLAAEQDAVIGNEVANVTGTASGLTRSGAGTASDPYTLAANVGNGLQIISNALAINSPTCAGTDKLQWTGSAFVCSTDIDTDTNTTYSTISNAGLRQTGTQFGLAICTNGQVLKATAVSGEYACAADNDTGTTYSAGTGLNLVGTTFNNTGVLTVTGSGPVSSSGGQNPAITFTNGTTNGQFWQWNGSSWALATLPAEQDSVIGNEVTDVTGVNSGLARSGAGTSVSPYTLAVSVGNGLQLTAGSAAINSPTCAGTTKLQWTGTAFVCSTDVDTDTNTTYSAGTGLSLVGTTFSNTGVLSATGSGAITSSGGQNPDIAFAAGTTTGQFWQWNGSAWALATLAAEQDAIIGNEVTNVTGAASGLVRSGAGTAGSPYTLAANVGNGLQIVSNAIAINSPTCAGTDKLQWTGSAFVCSADVDTDTNTTYSTITNGGLRQSGTQFGLAVCTNGQLLKATVTSGEYACAADNDTTYSAGTGLGLAGTTFSNTGVLSTTGSGAITSSGGQNPNIAFADGITNGQFWQWNGTAWALATLPAEQDAVIGNEVTNVTGAASGLTRSGSGTAGSPYTLAANVGNGLQILSNAIAVDSPTCAGTTKLQWTGTAFVCSTDVDTDTNTTYTADGQGIELSGTTFSLELNGTSLAKSASGLSLNLSNANTWAALQTYGAGTTITTGQNFTINGDIFTDLTGNGLTVASNVLTINSPTCAGTTKLQWNGTAFVCSADVDTTDFTIADGTTSQAVAATQAITFLGDTTTKTKAVLGGTRQITFSLDTTGASTGQALIYNGTALAWGAPTPSACSAFSTYFCSGGNSLGGTLTMGAQDNFGINFITNNITTFSLSATGAIVHKNTSNSQAAFNVLNAAGASMFTIDTTNNEVIIGEVTPSTGQNAAAKLLFGDDCNHTGSCVFIGEAAPGDSDVLQLHGANGLAFSTGYTPTTRVYINSAGNLMVGANAGAFTPGTTAQLNIDNGTATNAFVQFTNGTTTGQTSSDGLLVGTDGTGVARIIQRENNSLVISTNNTPVIVALGSGNVGVGNNAPGFILHVGSSATTTGTSVARFENAGGTCTVTPNTAGGITCTSDERLKKNTTAFDGALEIINQIDVKQYNMLADADGSQKQIGVMAQQLERVLPSLVLTDKDGYKSVSYSGLAPVLLQAVKEQQAQINALREGVWSGGLVAKDATFNGLVTFNKNVRFAGSTTFDGDVAFKGPVTFTSDTTGTITIPAGQTEAHVRFNKAAQNIPKVAVSSSGFTAMKVEQKSVDGFVIKLQNPSSDDVGIDWTALQSQ